MGDRQMFDPFCHNCDNLVTQTDNLGAEMFLVVVPGGHPGGRVVALFFQQLTWLTT